MIRRSAFAAEMEVRIISRGSCDGQGRPRCIVAHLSHITTLPWRPGAGHCSQAPLPLLSAARSASCLPLRSSPRAHRRRRHALESRIGVPKLVGLVAHLHALVGRNNLAIRTDCARRIAKCVAVPCEPILVTSSGPKRVRIQAEARQSPSRTGRNAAQTPRVPLHMRHRQVQRPRASRRAVRGGAAPNPGSNWTMSAIPPVFVDQSLRQAGRAVIRRVSDPLLRIGPRLRGSTVR